MYRNLIHSPTRASTQHSATDNVVPCTPPQLPTIQNVNSGSPAPRVPRSPEGNASYSPTLTYNELVQQLQLGQQPRVLFGAAARPLILLPTTQCRVCRELIRPDLMQNNICQNCRGPFQPNGHPFRADVDIHHEHPDE